MPHHTSRPAGPRVGAGARTRALRLAAPAVLCLLALSACGGGGAKATPGVASLPSSDAPAATSAGSTPGSSSSSASSDSAGSDSAGSDSDSGVKTARPQERLDDTPAEREALIHAWDQCLVDHGAHWTTTRSGVAGGPKQIADPIPPAAHAACENKLPLEPPELNPAINTHYRDDTLANIKCLRAHGVMVHLVADTSVDPKGLSWTFDSSTTKVPDNEGDIESQCQLAAFGGGKAK